LGVFFQFQPVQLESDVGLAELFPRRSLVIEKVFQVVKMVGQIEQVFLQRVEPLDELLAVLVGDERIDERQPLRDLVLTGIVPGVCQLLVPSGDFSGLRLL